MCTKIIVNGHKYQMKVVLNQTEKEKRKSHSQPLSPQAILCYKNLRFKSQVLFFEMLKKIKIC